MAYYSRIRNTQMLYALILLSFTILFRTPASAQASSPAQTPPQPLPTHQEDDSPDVLRVRTELVQLDVVVRDAKEKLVTGLGPNDFTVYEDDKPQTIVSFEATTPQPVTQALPIHSTTELDQREPEAPVTIVVLDEMTTKFEDQYFARYSLERYLSKQSEMLDQPTTLIARSLDRTMVLCDYTTSKKKILQSLDHHLAGNDWRANNISFADVQMAAAFASLLEVIKATQGHPGHKNIVWIGRGLVIHANTLEENSPASVRLQEYGSKCIELLRKARITLYAIDPAGVTVDPGTMDENGVITTANPFGGSVSFDILSQASGGLSMHGRNDVDKLIDTAVANGKTFYTLTYRPSSPSNGDPKQYRKIRIALKDPTLTAISRQGYFPGVNTEELQPGVISGKLTHDSQFDLASASSGLMVFDGVPLTITRQDAALGKYQVSFPASAVGLTESNGKLTGDVTLIAISYDKEGKLLATDGRVISLHLSPLSAGQTEDRKVQIAAKLNSPAPPARVRVVLRANTNGRIGANNLFLVDPASLKDRATGLKAEKSISK